MLDPCSVQSDKIPKIPKLTVTVAQIKQTREPWVSSRPVLVLFLGWVELELEFEFG